MRHRSCRARDARAAQRAWRRGGKGRCMHVSMCFKPCRNPWKKACGTQGTSVVCVLLRGTCEPNGTSRAETSIAAALDRLGVDKRLARIEESLAEVVDRPSRNPVVGAVDSLDDAGARARTPESIPRRARGHCAPDAGPPDRASNARMLERSSPLPEPPSAWWSTPRTPSASARQPRGFTLTRARRISLLHSRSDVAASAAGTAGFALDRVDVVEGALASGSSRPGRRRSPS